MPFMATRGRLNYSLVSEFGFITFPPICQLIFCLDGVIKRLKEFGGTFDSPGDRRRVDALQAVFHKLAN